jgi:hypothetical protein
VAGLSSRFGSNYLSTIRTPHLLLDREGVVVGALAGRPRDETWETVHDTAFKALRSAGKSMGYNPKETSNRRGSFPTVAHGISFGGGQQVSRFSLRTPAAAFCNCSTAEARVSKARVGTERGGPGRADEKQSDSTALWVCIQ